MKQTKKKQFGIDKIFRLAFASMAFAVFSLFVQSGSAHAATCSSATAFKMVVKTDNTGTSNSSSFTIPTTGAGYSYRVDINGNDNWTDTSAGSGWNETTNRTGASTINFGSPGTYTIAICGTFPRIHFNNGGDRQKVLSITQWGDNTWTSMQNAFFGATNLDVDATDAPDLSNVTNLASMFRVASSLTSDLNNWDTSNITDMNYVFYQASLFNGDISDWDTGNVTTMHYTLANTSFNQDISGWDVSSVTHMSTTFSVSPFNQDISNWDTGNVTNMQALFQNTPFNQNISGWDVSNVTNMKNMFLGNTAFNQPIGNWDTGSLTNLDRTFQGATAFNQDISGWDVSSVTDMTCLFDGTSFNQDISGWDTGNVTSMFAMFRNNTAFNHGIGNWDTAKVTTMADMFRISTFNRDISNWDTSKVTNTMRMFQGATAFNQDISSWDTGLVTNMSEMFQGATNFNQDLSSWDVNQVTNFTDFMKDASLNLYHYDRLLAGWANQSPLASGIVINFGDSLYCDSTARASLTNTPNNWTITDSGEAADVICNADGNGDGTPDRLQSNVITTMNPVIGSTTTLETTGDCLLVDRFEVQNVSDIDSSQNPEDYPLGLNDFKLGCNSIGATASVTIYYDQKYDTTNLGYHKYLNDDFVSMQTFSGFSTKDVDPSAGMHLVTAAHFTIQDGGLYDLDNNANGSITDPSGPAVTPVVLDGDSSIISHYLGTLANTGVDVRFILVLGSILGISSLAVLRFNS